MTHNTLKMAQFDLALVKPYLRTILFSVVPILILLFIGNGSLMYGMMFSMSFAGIAVSYPFTISEKNKMERLYAVLPISKKEMVFGRYLYAVIIGLLMLGVSLLAGFFTFMCMNIEIFFTEIFVAVIFGVNMLECYILFLLPAYYQFGTIKGRFCVFFPMILSFAIWGLASDNIISIELYSLIVLFGIIMMIPSAIISVRILQKKDI